MSKARSCRAYCLRATFLAVVVVALAALFVGCGGGGGGGGGEAAGTTDWGRFVWGADRWQDIP